MPYLPVDPSNTAVTTVGSALTATATSLTVATGGGAVLAAGAPLPFYVRLGANNKLSEIAQVTAIATDTLTLVRGVNRTASAWAVGATVQVVAPANEEQLFHSVSAALAGVGLPTLTGNTAVATGAAGTIATTGLGVSKVNPAASRTGCILQAGVVDGQMVVVANVSASNTITFAASGTSFVADGTSDVIAAVSAALYVWEATTALWYRV